MIPALIQPPNPCPWPILPPGIHEADLDEIRQRFATTPHRKRLFRGFVQALHVLAGAGCSVVYLNGSFTTGKPHPNDFDACWDHNGVDPSLLDPVLLDFDNKRANQKAKYGGELFLACSWADPQTQFLDYFQKEKHTDEDKGIIKIDITYLATGNSP